MVERRLGRGLDFFLTDKRAAEAAAPKTGQEPGGGATAPARDAEGGVSQLDIASLRPNPEQPRRTFDEAEIKELADSIRATGMLQPILARKQGDGFQIVAGERRWRAAQSAGLERVPVLVKDITDDQVAVFAVVENLHRSDLNPVEKARGFRRIQQLTKGSTEEVARKVGLDRSTVANFIRLLELPAEVLAHVSRGTLSMGHARALLGLPGSDVQRQIADETVRQKLSVRQVEELVQRARQSGKGPDLDASGKPKARAPKKDAWVREAEETLSEALGTAVSVKYGRRKAKIVIEAGGRDEFERLLARLQRDD